jgi:hypothetical protein
MATPTIQQGRLITKRSAIPGTVPTVPAVDDIETFISTDIFKGELFYNIPDNILYTRDNTGIVIIASGGAPITYVYYTENTTPGSEEAKIEVIDGSDSSYVLTQPTQIEINSTDGTDTTTQLIASNNFNVISSDGTDDSIIDINFNLLSLNSNQVTNDVLSKIDLDPANLASVDGTYIRTEQISTGEYSQIKIPYNAIILESTDGTNGNILIVNGDGTGSWETSPGSYIQKIEMNANDINLQSTLSTLSSNILISPGFIQHSGLTFYKKTKNTTTNTPTGILNVSLGLGITSIKVRIVALSTTNGYGAEMFGVFKNIGGTVTQVSTTDLLEKSDFSTATIDFNISGTTVTVRVIGEAATTIDWIGEFELLNS